MTISRASILGLILLTAAGAMACDKRKGGQAGGCGSDKDCKGDRICVDSKCVDGPGAGKPRQPGAVKPNLGDSTQPSQPGAAQPTPPPAAGGPQTPEGYRLDRITPVKSGCRPAYVVFSSARPESFGGSHGWPMADQALHEHPQFEIRDHDPSREMQYRLELFEHRDKPGVWALTARCYDGDTCNRIAAMYQGVVPSGQPQVLCGESIPGMRTGSRKTVNTLSPKFYDNVRFKCARLAVCMHKQNRLLETDPGMDCQRAPSNFKLSCWKHDSCAAVVSCASK